MIKSIVVIPFNLPWEWSTDYTNQTAFLLAQDNIVICYMWSEASSIKEYLLKGKFPRFFHKHSKNIYLIYPTLLIPFRRFRVIADVNENISIFLLKTFVKYLEIKNHITKKILWIFDPKLYPLIKKFGEEYFLLYDCVDYIVGTPKTKRERGILTTYERSLVKKANVVTANSIVLQKHLQMIRSDIHLVPQGFRIDSFRKRIINTRKIKRGKRPLIGYLGAVNYRIDYFLLYHLAKNNPLWDFALWGPLLQKDLFTSLQKKYYNKLSKLPNVIRGQSSKSHVPIIVDQFDIGIIPYVKSADFNKYSYPMKVFEYFYLGKPVVSTNILELKRFLGFVTIGNNSQEWKNIIKKILSKKWPEKYIREERRLAEKNSWKSKISEIMKYL